MPGPYSAGTVFLQVIPSFANFQNKTRDQARDMGRQMGAEMGGEFDDEFGKQAGKSTTEHGKKAGENFSGAFRSSMRSSLQGALSDLGKDIDKTLGEASKGLNNLKNAKIGVKFSAEDALRDLAIFEKRMDALSKESPSLEVRFNAAQALKQAQAFRTRVEATVAKPVDLEVRLGGSFEDELLRRVKAAQASLPELEIQVGAEGFQAEMAKIRAELGQLSDAKIDVNMEDDEAIAKVVALKAALDNLARGEVNISARMDLEHASEELGRFIEQVRPVEVPLAVNDGAFATQIRAAVTKAKAALPEVEVDANTSPADRKIAELRARLVALEGADLNIDVDGGVAAAAELTDIHKELNSLDRDDVNIRVKTNAKEAAGELAALSVVESKTARDGQLTANSFRAFNGALLAAVALGPALVPVLASIAGGLLALGPAAAVGGAGVLGLIIGFSGIGTAVKALQNVQKNAGNDALTNAKTIQTAANSVADAQRSLDRARTQSARAAEDSAEAVSNARRSESRAEASAAQDAQDAADRVTQARQAEAQAEAQAAQDITQAERRVEDARKSYSRTAESVADSVKQALARQADAEQNIADAQRQSLKAQQDLEDARKQAAEDEQDLQDRIAQNALDQRQNAIDLRVAQVEYQNVMADSQSTGSDKETASIGYERAKLAAQEAQTEGQRLAEQQAKFEKTGIDGTDRVTQALEAQTAATRQQEDAEKQLGEAADAVNKAREDGAQQLADAQQQITDALDEQGRVQARAAQSVADAQKAVSDALEQQQRTAVNSAQSVADAQQAVADAVRNQQRQQVDGAQGVEDAQRNLDQANQSYQEALTKTGDVGSASMRQLRQAMGALGPEGRAFAEFLANELIPQFQGFRSTLQAGLLPGVTDALRELLTTYGPGLNSFLKVLGTTLGGIARQVADSLTGPQWQAFFATLAQITPGILANLATIGLQIGQAFATLMTALAPFSARFVAVLAQLATQFAGFLAAFVQSKAFSDFMAYVAEVGPKVMDFFMALGGAFINLAIALAPLGELVVTALTGILNWIAGLDPKTLGLIALTIVGMVVAFQAAMGIMSSLGVIAMGITAVIGGVPIAVIGAIVATIIVLGTALVALWTQSQTFRTIVTAAFGAVWDSFQVLGQIFMLVWKGVVEPVFDAFVAIVEFLWNNIVSPLFGLIGDYFVTMAQIYSTVWNEVLKPVFDAFVYVIQALWTNIVKPYFDLISDIFSALGATFLWVWNNVLGPVFDLFTAIVKVLWDAYVKPNLDAIGSRFNELALGIKAAYDTYLKPTIDAFASIISTYLKPVFDAAMQGIASAWDTLRDAARKPIEFVVNTIINDGFVKGFNVLADAFGTKEIQPLKLPDSFYKATGGRIPGSSPNPRADNIPIMATAGEWMQPVDSVNYYGTGIMEAMRRKAIPREFFGSMGAYAHGGLIALGKRFQQMGARVSENKDFGGVTPVHAKNSRHYAPDPDNAAIDVNTRPGESPQEQAELRPLADLAKSMGFRVIFMEAGHFNHLHVDTGDGPSQDGGGGGGSKDPGLLDHLLHPIDYVKSLVSGPLAQLADNPLSQLFGGIANGLVDGIVGKIKDIAGTVGDLASGAAGAVGSAVGAIKDFFTGGKSMQDVVKNVAAGYGWDTGAQWDALKWIVNTESGFNPNAQNKTSTAYGLFQFLNSTWAGVGGKKTSDPNLQSQYGLKYIKQAYGNPVAAMAFHKVHGWYGKGGEITEKGSGGSGDVPTNLFDSGGIVPPGLSQIMNLTGGNEYLTVMTPQQIDWAQGRDTQSGPLNDYSGSTFVLTDYDEFFRQQERATADAVTLADLRATASGVNI